MSKGGPRIIELAVLEMRRDAEVRLADMEGRLALLHQRNKHTEQQEIDWAHQVDDLVRRLNAAERVQVTRRNLDDRFRHTVAVLSLLAATASAITGPITIVLTS
ncbi:hypothetical protein [Actinomadura fibrosa]|uniref:Coil containing protein n=1 Tax=Actinomadura fibrosa TaxID=111802 RepID=A0ABW2XIH5_9ACTN|nr:hypothetical protein [Actinomadura fibrosa]